MMEHLDNRLQTLEPGHREALTWFHAHRDDQVTWAELVALGEQTGQRLVTAAKGIYKPEGWRYALSVRQVLNGPYPDHEPVARRDGTWLYRYFQENSDPALRDEQFTNRGLMACMHDHVPVGVLLQVSPKPTTRYRVLGVALVAHWSAGYFYLDGFNPDGAARTPGLVTETEALLHDVGLQIAAEEQALGAQTSTLGTSTGGLFLDSALEARRHVLSMRWNICPEREYAARTREHGASAREGGAEPWAAR